MVRDYVLHELIIGRLCGRFDCGIDIVALMRRYLASGATAKYGQDRRILGLIRWSLIRNRSLVHDKHFLQFGGRTMPLYDPQSRFGATKTS